MTVMLDRPAGDPAGLGPHTIPVDLVDDWDIEEIDPRPYVDFEVVDRLIARAAGRWTPPIPKPSFDEQVAVARYYVDRGYGPTAVAKALHTNGTKARRLVDTARLDQVLDAVEAWL